MSRGGEARDWRGDEEEQAEGDDSEADGDDAVEVMDGKAGAESADDDDDGQRPA